MSERGAAWLAHLSGGQGVVGSNPAAPTTTILQAHLEGTTRHWTPRALASSPHNIAGPEISGPAMGTSYFVGCVTGQRRRQMKSPVARFARWTEEASSIT
jgi:hypothetical protein